MTKKAVKASTHRESNAGSLDATLHSNTPVSINDVHLKQYLDAATSENTRRAYRSAIRQFEKWGGRLPSHRDEVVRYLLDRAESVNTRTLDLHLTALSQWHQYQSIADPCRNPLIRKTMEGIRRVHGQPKRKAKALQLSELAKMLDWLKQQPASLKHTRDISILLLGFFGAFRRSELVNIQVSDLCWEPEGLIIQLPKSKTDQTGQGSMRAIPFADKSICAAQAVKTWLDAAGLADGFVFRPINRWGTLQNKALNPNAINDLLKKMGERCEFDFTPDLSSHSFRRGLSTSAARAQVPFEQIKKQGGWKSDSTVWQYIDEGQQFTDNAASTLLDKMAELVKAKY